MQNSNGKPVDPEIYVLQSRICKAFANPIRLQLLDLLAERDWFASELQQRLHISNPNLSQHLAVLRTAGVVATRRQGKQMLCSLAMPQVKSACRIIRDVLRTQIEKRHSLAV
ncbi:MAG: metalloregulator ArsR/SmtB family transcription factor [Acidobacteriia bacterium]|nr:metalloregulator ArsR/SmtB family transcription factor [Terriglobia bacterium]